MPGIVAVDESCLPALRAFLDGLPDRDLTFVKEDVRDPALVEAWARETGPPRRWVARDDDTGAILALVAVMPLTGWSAHVGELRLVVAPDARRQGLGAALARHALRAALGMGLLKVVVEVVAEQESAIAMFDALGFRGEALLTRQIRDHAGELRDLLVLTHDAEEEWSSMAAVGLDEEVGG